MWTKNLAPRLKIPLINADRMMLSILPEPRAGKLPEWARQIRDKDENWMRVAQLGVQAFVAQAMGQKVAFAMETVFSHWREHADGRIESKIDQIRELQAAGYFVLLLFVGLTNDQLSIGRVATRVSGGGHDVDLTKLTQRFPRTQKAIRQASFVANATIMMDNSRNEAEAFTVCRVQLGADELFDVRDIMSGGVPIEILPWLEKVAPR